jgi:hemoglobin
MSKWYYAVIQTDRTKNLLKGIRDMNTVNAAVGIFYKKVLIDNSISKFFAHTETQGQSGKLKSFLAYAFGPLMAYAGKKTRDAYAHMHQWLPSTVKMQL